MVGILGNGATLKPLASSGSSAEPLLSLKRIHGAAPPPPPSGQTYPATSDWYFDHHSVFMTDLNVDLWNGGNSSQSSPAAVEIKGCKFFHVQDCEFWGRGARALSLNGFQGDGIYYVTFENVKIKAASTGLFARGYADENQTYGGAGSTAIYTANVGFHNCEVTFNVHGMECQNSSLTIHNSHFHNNTGARDPITAHSSPRPAGINLHQACQ